VLPDGVVLVAGGVGVGLSSAEIYDVGLGFSPAWQPQITSLNSPLSLGGNLVLTGSRFRGLSEGSGGNGGQNSAANYPLVQVRSLESGQTAFLPSAQGTSWSATSFTSGSLSGFPVGYALVTVFVNGIPSNAGILDAGVSAPRLNGPTMLPGGSFRIDFTASQGLSFKVLAASDIAVTTWTVLGLATETSAGNYSFTDAQAPNFPRRFYKVCWP